MSILENGGLNVHDSSSGADFVATGCAAHLALQSLLGLLPEWRTWFDRNCRFSPTSRRSLVNQLLREIHFEVVVLMNGGRC